MTYSIILWTISKYNELVQSNLPKFYWVPKNLKESLGMIFVETEAIFTKFCFPIENFSRINC